MSKDFRTTTRKVEVDKGKWRRLGMYNPDRTPVIGDVIRGHNYLARLNGDYIPVRAGGNQLMYPIERLKEVDPRAEESRRRTAANGFDLDSGQYVD